MQHQLSGISSEHQTGTYQELQLKCPVTLRDPSQLDVVRERKPLPVRAGLDPAADDNELRLLDRPSEVILDVRIPRIVMLQNIYMLRGRLNNNVLLTSVVVLGKLYLE